MLLTMFILAAILGLIVWALVHWLTTRTPISEPTGPTAMEILRQRYARGKIGAATFEKMQGQLDSRTQTREPTSVS